MKRFIDANKLKEAFYTDTEHLQSWDVGLFDLLMMDIDEAPTADVEEVYHGEWIYCGSDARRCSYCGHELSATQAEYYKGCPICRAKMDKRKGDNNA